MFFDLVRKNTKRDRKENGLFFISLIISIVAFYIILSLERQDVMIFLKTMESDAIDKLFRLISVLYVASLFLLFFLLYFAGRGQLERRSHEFGIYLMMGMSRNRLFMLLMAEELYNSIVSLVMGIPIAVIMSEIISLVIAKVVGLGIIGHRFTFSLTAVVWTIIGYMIIRMMALIIISSKMVNRQIDEMLNESQEDKRYNRNIVFLAINLVMGIALLVVAYYYAITGSAWIKAGNLAITMIMGVCGTVFLLKGIAFILDMVIKDRSGSLDVFTYRQLQENVLLKSNSLAMSSLMVLVAFCCLGYGIAVSLDAMNKEKDVIDYTFRNTSEEVDKVLEETGLADRFSEFFTVKTGMFFEKEDGTFNIDALIDSVKAQPDSPDKETLLNNLSYFTDPYIISLSGYNEILKADGREEITLADNQVALYSDPDYTGGNLLELGNNALESGTYVSINGEKYDLIDEYCNYNIVTDRMICISYGLIVDDRLFEELLEDSNYSCYYNGVLKSEVIRDKGLMQAMDEINSILNTSGLEYESYITSMGRQLFYSVSAGYITIYLAIIFIIIANTVMGVQFLMQEQKTIRRYGILNRIGCDYNIICKSARTQIRWYYIIPLSVAAISSIFGIRSLFTVFSSASMREKINELMIIALVVVVVFLMIEAFYVRIVMKMSDKRIYDMMIEQTGEK